jgi:hypothetical protein
VEDKTAAIATTQARLMAHIERCDERAVETKAALVGMHSKLDEIRTFPGAVLLRYGGALLVSVVVGAFFLWSLRADVDANRKEIEARAATVAAVPRLTEQQAELTRGVNTLMQQSHNIERALDLDPPQPRPLAMPE